jgi:hypothetical protein
MNRLNSIFGFWIFLFIGGFFRIADGTAQDNFFKFPVTQEGIYRITASQALQLGVASVAELSIYGHPGMLSQKLDSADFELKEIPVKIIDGDLYFFLSAAPSIRIVEEMANYQTHLFTDTLYYLIQTKQNTITVPSLNLEPSGSSAGVLYQLETYKEDEYNLLSSGRNWYGNRVFDGEKISIDFEGGISQDLPFYYHVKLMAQSLMESNFTLSINQEMVENIQIPSIANSTYGVKGYESHLAGHINGPIGNAGSIVDLQFHTADRNGTGYLDYFIFGNPFLSSALPPGVFYNLSGKAFTLRTSDLQYVWDISDFFDVKDITSNKASTTKAQKIAVFIPEATPPITGLERVDINLRSQPQFSELLIITHNRLSPEAERLTAFKNSNGISTQVITVQEIYNAFGYGNPDITAIRNFLAFHYHQGKHLKNVLLFGKGTFDYKNKIDGRPNLVPTYSSRNSLSPLMTYSSDDYYGFLNMGEGVWEETVAGDLHLSIGVGRLPVVNLLEARDVVDKIINYGSPESTLGDWKRKVLFVADDGDNNVHLNDSEFLAAYLGKNHSEIVLEKLYLDNFEQIDTGSAKKSPTAKNALEAQLDSSVLLVNYIGHGNETTLMAEEVFTVSDLNNWPENKKLPVFVTATCEFGRHDSPYVRSGAEELLIAEKKGAIALLTTGRPVFSSINFALNRAFIEVVFKKEEGKSLTLGEIFKRTKNNSLNGSLNRNFSLLGDPSLTLALPGLAAHPNEFFDMALQTEVDTLKSLQQIRFKGLITHPLTQTPVDSFNGIFEISLTDKPLIRTTLGDENNPATYIDDQIYLHRGKGKVVDGHFEGEIFIPKNIDPTFGKGTLRLFAQDNKTLEEAFGADHIVIGGSSSTKLNDNKGPQIQLYIQDSLQSEKKVSSTRVHLLATLEDKNGINISPLHPDQPISLRINNGEKINLNPYYKSLNGSYTKGIVEAFINGLEEGLNILTLQAWDNVGNTSSQTIELRLMGSQKIRILSHHTYPNPASTISHFEITHNRPGENLVLQVQIFSFSGSKIFAAHRRFPKAGSSLGDISWIFMQNKTKYPAKGTYLYKLELKSEEDGSSDTKSGKIIIQ